MFKKRFVVLIIALFVVMSFVGEGQVSAAQPLPKTEQIGEIVEIFDRGSIRIWSDLPNSEEGYREIVLNINDQTEIYSDKKLTRADLKVGTIIKATFGPAMTMSIPPQTYASQINVIDEQIHLDTWIFATDHMEKFQAQFGTDTMKLILPEGRVVILPQVISASGARYSNGGITFWNKGEEAMIEYGAESYFTRVIDHYSYPWYKAAQAGIDFRAIGVEPGWVLEIVKDQQQLTFATNYGQIEKEVQIIRTLSNDQTGMQIVLGKADQQPFIVIVQKKAYYDSMSGEKLPYTVTILDGEETYVGGGRELL